MFGVRPVRFAAAIGYKKSRRATVAIRLLNLSATAELCVTRRLLWPQLLSLLRS